MIVHDISMTIKSNMKVYKNKTEKRPVLINTRDHDIDGMYESKISMDLHTGTHMDAPLHMIKGGKAIDKMPIEDLITTCRVLDLTHVTDAIEEKDLRDKNIVSGEFILLKTKNSTEKEFNPKFIYLGSSAANLLMEMNIKGVGTDGLGIERSQTGHITHKILFNNNIHILEGLYLGAVEEGNYTLIALPLKIENADASPIRAVLIEGLKNAIE